MIILDHAQPVPAAIARAIPGPDRSDNRALRSRRPLLGTADEDPLNRRGRRHFEAEVRRSERSIFRTSVRQSVEARAARSRA